jgi:hypothetical protein
MTFGRGTSALRRWSGFAVVVVMVTAVVWEAAPARAATDIVPYGSPYSYHSYPDSDANGQLDDYPPDWASPNPTTFDPSTFPSGRAPFGYQTYCGLPVTTLWQPLTALLARREFVLPSGASNVQVTFGVDNDAKIAINGQEITNDWIVNENCGEPGAYTINVPDAVVRAGTNLLAVLGRDRNPPDQTWLDLRVSADLPANRDPDCSTVTVSPAMLARPDHSLRLATLAGATDPDFDALQLSIDGVTQDEPISGLGHRDVSPDAVSATDPSSVYLRAEFDRHGDGRVYRVAFTVTDGNGGSCTGAATVGVPRWKKKAPIDSGQLYDSFGP